MHGEAWSQDLKQNPALSQAGPPPCLGASVIPPAWLQSTRCTPGPGPSWGAEVEGLRHGSHPLLPFPPLAQSQQDLPKPQSQIRAQLEPVLLAGLLVGGPGLGVVGSEGKPLAALWPRYQQPCPPPSPLAPLKFTHLIRGTSFPRESCYAFVSSCGSLPSAWPSLCPEDTVYGCGGTCWQESEPQTPKRATLLIHTNLGRESALPGCSLPL